MTHIYVNKLRHKGLTEEFDFIVAGMECIRIDLKKKYLYFLLVLFLISLPFYSLSKAF